ncbi:MAG: hypothetical protein FJY75_05600 [Candidatus Eisenbacteria bacterium]|uniref:Uncharacterized protein n=1 Tax=Eiseniibacteriota bacterium TaxID=2212470 RepID=A0A937XBH0_UNCEI|nr:hypothetical protein [Candidatus Eisenbacteria bacterium]
MSKPSRILDCAAEVYEPPRLEPSGAVRAPLRRLDGTPPLSSWNIVCNECSSGGH